jgi:hypothetical protein
MPEWLDLPAAVSSEHGNGARLSAAAVHASPALLHERAVRLRWDAGVRLLAFADLCA